MDEMDLAIRNGRVVQPDGTVIETDVGIRGEKIAALGGALPSKQDIDARGNLLLPGGIDPHVHLSPQPQYRDHWPRWVDDFASGSAAALAGGVTTIGNMVFPASGELPLAQLARERTVAEQQTIADVFLHPVIERPTPAVLEEISRLPEAGYGSIKLFTQWPAFDEQAAQFVAAMRTAAASGLLVAMHCEDAAIIAEATSRLIAAGKDSLAYYGESRPVVSEVVATQRALAFAEASGAAVYIVHLSAERALAVCAEARGRGLPIYVETRPLYLHLTQALLMGPEAGKYVGKPPLRERQDAHALWAGLRAGTVHTVGTDHAPWSLAAKLDPAHTLRNVRPGVADLQTMLPMLYSEGVRKGRISLPRFVEVTSTNAAKLFGLYPRKGAIAIGSDADIAIFNPNLTRQIAPASSMSRADYSPYDGWQVTGWPVLVLRRGEVVFRDGEVLGRPGSGLVLRQRPDASSRP